VQETDLISSFTILYIVHNQKYKRQPDTTNFTFGISTFIGCGCKAKQSNAIQGTTQKPIERWEIKRK
jgi:hypothetical protein